jgi:hypothetical protein
LVISLRFSLAAWSLPLSEVTAKFGTVGCYGQLEGKVKLKGEEGRRVTRGEFEALRPSEPVGANIEVFGVTRAQGHRSWAQCQ